MKTYISFLISLVICLTHIVSISNVHAQKELSAKQWQDDLKFLQTTVHNDYPFLFKKVSATDFDVAVDKLYEEIPSLDAHEIPVALARMVSMFKYGHTQITFYDVAKRGVLPVNLYHFNDGVYIEGVLKGYEKVLGAKVIKVGDKPVVEALAFIKPVVPVENESYFKAYGLRFLTAPDVLHAQGVIANKSNTVTMRLEKGGRTFDYEFPMIGLKDKPRYFNFTLPTDSWITARDTTQTPLYLKHLNDKLYYFEQLAGTKTVYVRQSSVFNDKDESLRDFYKRLFTYIDTNNIDKLVYDVRLNGGGNNYNNIFLIKELMARPKINKKGHFFFIIGRDTFSACQNLTNEIERYTEAILLGEPTAENVNFYGDNRKLMLPNSKINAYLSYAWWQDSAPWENRDATLPNIAVDTSFDQYKTNQDPVLQAALNYTDDGFILKPMEHLTELFLAGNYEQLKKDATSINNNPKYKYYDFENEFSKAAHRLIGGGHQQAGLFIFDLVAELNPKSATALYNLANLQVEMKQLEKAKIGFQKIIALDANSSLGKIAKRRLLALNKN